MVSTKSIWNLCLYNINMHGINVSLYSRQSLNQFLIKGDVSCVSGASSFKGPVELVKRVKIAHSFSQSGKSVPRYHFKLAYEMAVKEFFETHF